LVAACFYECGEGVGRGVQNMSMHFLDKGLQNTASTSMDVHNQLLQTKLGEKSKP
jgi:hypothetical protein